MALSTYSLVSVEEFKFYAQIGGESQDPLIEHVLNETSEVIEAHLGRWIVTRGSLTEYHTMAVAGDWKHLSELRTREWPILAVASVHEDTDWPRTYGADYLLTVATDYEVVAPSQSGLRSFIRRLTENGGPSTWETGSRAIRVVYTAGYANTAAVPSRLKGVALRYATRLYREIARQQQGVSATSDAFGNVTRLGAAGLTPDMITALEGERRVEFYETGERAA